MKAGALEGRRVVELCGESGAYCGKLFADAGADVVKVEAPGGDPSRGYPPLWSGAVGDATPSLSFLYNNTSKRSTVLDLELSRDRDRLGSIAADADLVVESFAPGYLDSLGVGFGALRARNPRLVLTSITGFGQTGPHSDYKSSDLVANALGGVMYVTGEADDPPVTLRGRHAHVMASTCAAASSLIAMLEAERSGRGQQVDISIEEVVASVSHIAGIGKWLDDGIVPRRMGSRLFASIPSGAYACRDGLVYLMVNRPAHWQGLARWIHEVTGEEAVLDPLFEGPSSTRFATRELVDHFVAQLTARFTVAEMYHEGQRRHLALAPVNRLSDVVADPHLQARGFFVEVEHAGGSGLVYPGAPYRSQETFFGIRHPAPEVGQHTEEILAAFGGPDGEAGGGPDGGPGEPKPGAAPAGHASRPAALEGVRVIEFTAGMAGPWIGRFMAYHGADVIKIESRARPDVTRQYVAPRDPKAGVQSQRSPWLTDWNAGKRCVALDLTVPDAAELAARLVADADVVIENYATGVMEKLGLSREVLFRAKPDLVMLSSTGYGDSGPSKDYISWGPNIEALSGLSALDGFPDRACTMTQYAYPDSLSALHGLFAVLAALHYKRRTGRGQYLNLSQLEASIAVVGELVMETLAEGREPAKLGNRSDRGAPHGCYPCAGEDRWCAIAALCEDEWERLWRVLSGGDSRVPDLASDPRFATPADRLRNAETLDAVIAEWTICRDAYDVMRQLQAAGVPAGVVQTARDKYENDAQLRQRGYFETIRHETLGEVVADGIPTGLCETPGRTEFAGRAMGADNAEVFIDLVGLSREEYESYIERGAIEE